MEPQIRKKTMAQKTGWLEKYGKGMIQSMVEVKYQRVKPKKTPRKKAWKSGGSELPNAELYYVLNKNASYGDLFLTGDSIFAKNEIIELEMFAARHRTHFRVLAKIRKVESFIELKRVLFRGEVHFAAINKKDFERLQALEAKRLEEESRMSQRFKASGGTPTQNTGSIKLTFKKG